MSLSQIRAGGDGGDVGGSNDLSNGDEAEFLFLFNSVEAVA